MKLFILALFLFATTFSKAQSVAAAISKGNDYYRQEQYDLAEQQYKAALEKEPSNTTAQYNLANALHKQKKWPEAHGVLKKLVDETTDNTLKEATYYNDGVAYSKEKNLEKSIEAYKGALRLNPDDGDARENLQKALSEQKKQQQQNQQQQKQQQRSNMSQKEAEQKIKAPAGTRKKPAGTFAARRTKGQCDAQRLVTLICGCTQLNPWLLLVNFVASGLFLLSKTGTLILCSLLVKT